MYSSTPTTDPDLLMVTTKAVKNKADNTRGFESISDPLEKNNFFMIVNGRPGQGKSSFVYNLIAGKRNALYNRKFHNVHWWSGSLSTLDVPLPKNRLHTGLDMQELDKTLRSIPPGQHTLMVFDDLVSELKKDAKPFLRLILNRRHVSAHGSLSVILCTQKLSMVPLQLRNAASTFVLFEMAKRESRIVYDELGDHATFDEWLQMLIFVYDRKYRFLLIRVNQPRALRYYKDFDLITLPA